MKSTAEDRSRLSGSEYKYTGRMDRKLLKILFTLLLNK